MRVALFLILGLTITLLTIHFAGSARWSARTRDLIARLDATQRTAAPAQVAASDIDQLPAPIAAHLHRAIPPGTSVIRAVDVVHEGVMNLSQTGEQWKPFTSRQRVVTSRPGFVWDARVRMFPGVTAHVHDAYLDGEGILEPAIAGLITLTRLADRGETARGELMRFMAEASWYPTALLPSEYLRWEAIDDRSARAHVRDGALDLALTFHIGADGLIESIRAESRGRTVGDHVVPTPWEGRMSNYQQRDGMLIPMDGEVAWITPERRIPYWRGRITSITYHH